MKSIVSFLLALCISASIAQITFTREWVKGKRSTTANSAAILKDEHSSCRSLVSAVEYLIELEKLRMTECTECCRNSPSALPILPDIQRSPADFMTFLRDIPPLEQIPQERLAPSSSDRRGQ